MPANNEKVLNYPCSKGSLVKCFKRHLQSLYTVFKDIQDLGPIIGMFILKPISLFCSFKFTGFWIII